MWFQIWVLFFCEPGIPISSQGTVKLECGQLYQHLVLWRKSFIDVSYCWSCPWCCWLVLTEEAVWESSVVLNCRWSQWPTTEGFPSGVLLNFRLWREELSHLLIRMVWCFSGSFGDMSFLLGWDRQKFSLQAESPSHQRASETSSFLQWNSERAPELSVLPLTAVPNLAALLNQALLTPF